MVVSFAQLTSQARLNGKDDLSNESRAVESDGLAKAGMGREVLGRRVDN